MIVDPDVAADQLRAHPLSRGRVGRPDGSAESAPGVIGHRHSRGQFLTAGTTLFNLPDGFNYLGQGRVLDLPLPVYFAIVISIVLWGALRFTTLGRRWHAIGGNVEVSRLSGVNVRFARLLAFTIAGLISAVGGILLAARLGSASAVQGSDNTMFSVAAVFLGMTVIKSGAANLAGTMVGVAIIGVMSNGLNILGVNAW